MVKFWVGFALLVAVIASLSNCDSMVIGNPFSVNLQLGGNGGERGSGVARVIVVHIEGAGKARVNATESLKAWIEGAGVITYSGEPKTVERTIDGIGQIRKVD